MIESMVTGRLWGAAEMRQGKNETQFAVAKVKVAMADGETLLVNVIAFATQACAALTALNDGDAVTLTGALTPKVWTDKQGNTKPCVDLVAHHVLSVYQANNSS